MEEDIRKKKRKRKKIRNNILLGLVFLGGLAVLAYPQISRLYYRVESSQQVADFEASRDALEEEIARRMGLAQAYNDALNNVVSQDPYDEERREEGLAEYARMLEVHEKIGIVEVPTIDQKLPSMPELQKRSFKRGQATWRGPPCL